MKILITGATGLIGSKLGQLLHDQGHEITVLTRNTNTAKSLLPFPAKIFSFQNSVPLESLNDIEIIFNFAGTSIGESRWTRDRKNEIYDSRIKFTNKLVTAINQHLHNGQSKIKKLISVSAIGFYGDRSDEILTESSRSGDDFLSQVCIDWEKESHLVDSKIEVINPRIGIVLDPQGGALEKMLPLFRDGIGSPLGNGKQWMSWIHIEDLINMFNHLIHSKLTGPINAVAPNPTTNKDFSFQLAKSFGHKMYVPNAPSFILKAILGDMSTLVLSSQRVSSNLIVSDGFKFKYSNLNDALNEISTHFKKSHETLIFKQWIPKKPDEVFPFFADENNLESITPDFFNFRVLDKSTANIQNNTIINYKMKLYGIPFKWRTQILNWDPPKSFVDIQLKGPYKSWHHHHELISYSNGTLLKDTVTYKLPLGIIGRLIANFKVRSDVVKIFKYRREIIAKLFY